MKLDLPELLTLVGRLDDAPGTDTPRDRFRRFLTEQVTSVAAVRGMLDQTHAALSDQHARARQDLILLLGRFLGFEIAFGTYESVAGGVRLEGHWRSRRHARLAIEVRSEQTVDADVETLTRTVAALSASLPGEAGEKWVGLCVTTPFYAAVRRLQAQLAQRQFRDIRCISLDSLLWLADMAEAKRVDHADVLRLLSSGPDSDFMVSLMRRLTESAGGHTSPTHDPVPASSDEADPSPRLSIVSRPEPEPEPVERPDAFWLVTLFDDETATPEQLLDAVIARRQVLGLAQTGFAPAAAAQGDWVCFHIGHIGIVGHAQLDGVISDASAVIRGAERFSAVFRLRNVSIYEVPRVIVRQTIDLDLWRDVPPDAAGAFISPLSRDEYERLTMNPGGWRAANS
jgi:hypothetical protein